MHFQLKIHIKNHSPEIINFQVDNKTPLIVQHSKQEMTFELYDPETQLAPKKLLMKREGNNLHIFIDENEQVDVVIVDYYAYEPLSPIMGVSEDGRLYAYLAESNLAADSIPHLAENVLATQVLSGTGVALGALPFNWTPFLYALGGIAGAGLVAEALKGGSDNATNLPAINARHTTGENNKKTGGIEVETSEGIRSYEIEFVPTGSNKPVVIRFEAQPDGSFKLTEESKAKLPAGVNLPDVPAGEAIKLPPELVKDGSTVKVTVVDNNGVQNSTTLEAPFDANVEKLELGKIEVLNTHPSAVKLPVDTDPNSKVSVVDKAGNKVAGPLPVDSKGHKTLEFLLDPNDPNRDELSDFTVVSEKPGANPATLKLSDLPAEKLPTEKEVVNADPVELATPTVKPATEENAGKKFEVDLGEKKDNVKTINVVITDPAGDKSAVEKLEKDAEGKFTKPSDPNSKIKDVINNPDGSVSVVLKDDVAKDSKVSVTTENGNSQSQPSTPVKVTDNGVEAVDTTAEPLAATNKPNLVEGSVKSINQGESTPTNPEAVEFKLENVTPNTTLIPTLVKADGTRTPLPSVKPDVNGKVRLADTEKADIQAGDKIELIAVDPNKGNSEKLEVEVPAVNEHRFDSLPPVQPTIETTTQSGDGGATVDASGIKPGETLTIQVVKPEPAPNGTPATLEFTKQEDGSLKPAENNPQDVKATVNGDKVTIDEGSLKDNSQITAAITDPAGNTAEADPATVGYDQPTERNITLNNVTLADKDPVADHDAERITGEVNGVKAGDTLHFEDDLGNKLSPVKVPEDYDPTKPFTFDIPSMSDNKNPANIKVSVQEKDKAPTAPVVANLDPNKLTHSDTTPPPAATIAQNDEKLSVSFDPTQTDELTVVDKETGKPIVKFTKDPATGVFKSDNPKVADIPAGKDVAEIPKTALPKETTKVVANTSDIAANSSESAVTPVKPAAKDPNKEPNTEAGNDNPDAAASTPNSTVAPTKEGAIVKLDPNAKEGDKSVVRTQPKGENGKDKGDAKEDTYVFKDGKWQPDADDKDAAPVTNGNEVNVVAPSKAEITVTNSRGDKSATTSADSGRPADAATQPEVNAVQTTNTPTELKVTKLIDENNPLDGKTDRFEITGKVDGGKEGTELFVHDADGNKLITSDLKWNEDGTFTVTVTESPNKDLEFGRETPDTLTFTAKNPDQNASAATPLTLAKQEGQAEPSKEYPNDQLPPEQPTVTPNVADGGVRVKLPTDTVAGDKLAVKYTPTGADAETTVTLVKQPDGSWKTDPENADFPTVPASEEYLNIPEGVLKDGSTVTAKVTDLAGRSSEHSAKAGKDAQTNDIVDLSIEGIDLDNSANLSAEKVKIKGKVLGEPADTPVKLTLPSGQEIEVKTKDNGEFEIILVKDGANNPQVEGEVIHKVPTLNLGDQLNLQATAAGKKPSEAQTVAVPEVKTTKTNEKGEEVPLTKDEKQALHPNDKTNEMKVALKAATDEGDGSVTLDLPTDAKVGDQVVVEYIPDNQEADEPKATLTLTKTDNGWKSSEPSVTIDGDKATLPETLLKDGKEVSAKAVDLAGNESTPAATATAGADEITPKLGEIKPVDTNNEADKLIDALVVKGTAEPSSTVTLGKEGEATALGTVTAGQDSNFTVLVVNPNAENAATDEAIAALKTKLGLPADTPVIKATDANKLAAGDKLTIKAETTGTGNEAKTGEAKAIPELTATKADHPFDTTPPADVTLAPSETQGAMKVTVPAEAKAGDVLVLDFKKPAEAGANPAEPTPADAKYEKQQDGSWNIVGDNPHGLPATIPAVADNQPQVLEIPKDKLADNQDVTAKLMDQAGNSSAKLATEKAPFDDKTDLKDVKVSAKNKAEAGSNDVDPDSLEIEGYTQPGAKVTIELTKADGTKVTKEITAPSEPEQGRDDGLAKFTHKFEEGEGDLKADDISVGEGKNITITATLEDQRAPSETHSQPIPQTRTVFLEVDQKVQVIDKGTKTDNEALPYNQDVSDDVIDEVKLTGNIEENAKLVVEVYNKQGELVAKRTFANAPSGEESALNYTNQIASTEDGAKVNGNGTKVTSGKFAVTLDRTHLENGKQFEPGQTIKVRAENTDNSVSKGEGTVAAKTVPAFATFSSDEHPDDKKVITELGDGKGDMDGKTMFVEFAPQTTGEHKGKQEATVKLPKVSSEVRLVDLKFLKDGTGVEETIQLTRDDQNQWKLNAGGEQLGLSITQPTETDGFPTLKIPHNLLKGTGTAAERGKVKVTLTDRAENTLVMEKEVPADETTYLKVLSVTPVDVANNNVSDGNPDKVKVEVQAEVGTTVTVTINGKTVSKKIEAGDGTEVSGVTDADGETLPNVRKVVIEVPEAGEPATNFGKDDVVTVTASSENGADSSDSSKTVGENLSYEDASVTGWKNNPVTVTHNEAGEAMAEVALPDEAETDVKTFSIQFNKQGETNNPVTVTYTKGESGWTTDDAKGTTLEEGKVKIPANVLKGGADEKIKVKATDLAGNKTGEEANQNFIHETTAADKTKTATPTKAPEVAVQDLDEEGNESVERIFITGGENSVPANAEVFLLNANGERVKDAQGQDIKTTAGQDGGYNFSLTKKDPAGSEEHKVKDFEASYKVQALVNDGNHSPSETVDVPNIPTTVPRGTEADKESLHPNDSTKPVQVTVHQGNEDVVVKVPVEGLKKGDRLVIKDMDKDQNTEGTELGTFDFDGEKWTASGSTNLTPPAKSQDGSNWEVTVSASGEIVSGDFIKGILYDYAGNQTDQSAEMPNVDPTHIDPVKIFVGSTTRDAADSANKDPHKADRLKLEVGQPVNSGEIYVKPGADNTEVSISYFNESGEAKHIVAEKSGGSWKFYEGTLNTTENDPNAGQITKGSATVDKISTVQVGNETYFKLAADEVQDYNSVLVRAKDNQGNNATDEKRSDFDDSTENALTAVAPTQESADANIKVTLTDAQSDVVYYVVSFDASHVNANDANTLGVNNTAGDNNFIVVRKGSDGKWSANFFAGDGTENRASFDYFSEGESAVPYLQSFNKDTGSIELKKDYVRGNSGVTAKFVDAYGMFAESTLATKHSPTETPIQVDAPEVKALGNGLMSIVAGEVDYHEQGGNIQPKGTDFKTVVKHNDKTYTIKYNSTSNQYELEEPQDGSTKVSFDSSRGKLVISSTSADKVTALAEKMYDNQKYTSGDPVEATFVLTPPSAEEDKSADPVWIETMLNGNVKVHVGEDNVRLVLKMVRQNVNNPTDRTEETIVFKRDKPTDHWQYASDDQDNSHTFEADGVESFFDLNHKTSIALNHGSDYAPSGVQVKDGTKVTATGFDQNGNSSSDVKYSLVDDGNSSETKEPTFSMNSNDVVIKPNPDQHTMFITIQPPRPEPEDIFDLEAPQPELPPKQHMVLRLENDTWTLKYYDPVNKKELEPVPSVVAEIIYPDNDDPNNRPQVKVKKEYLSNEPAPDNHTPAPRIIEATGVDNYGNQRTGTHEYTGSSGTVETPPEKTPQVTFANGSDTAAGSVTINPQPDHNRLTVEYINEKDLLVNAILVKEGNRWKLAKLSEAGKPSDFDFSNGIRLNANALKDSQPNGLKVVAQAEGKLNSDSAVHTPEPNYVPQTPPQPPVPEVLTGLGDKLNGTTNTVKVTNDVTHRVFARAGWNELKKALTDAGLGTMDAPTRSDPYTKIVLKEKGGEGVALNVNGAFGDTTPPEVSGGWNIFGTWTRGVKLTGTEKNDIIVTATDFGEDEVNAREHSMNLGNGHDVLIVGGNNPNHKLYENNSGTTPATRYAFDKAGQRGWTEVDYRFEGTQSDQGGVLNKAKIEMGEGNDLIAIEGMSRRVQPAVDRSLVDLGAGDDSLIIAHTNEQNMSNKRHSLKSYNIADDSTVRTGAGNDYIKAGGISGNAKVYMEGDNDTVELLRMYDGGSVLDMGAGDDILIITSEVRDFARINLGDGNDVFQFGGGISKLHRFGREALFEGELEGGRGYDILVVKSPQAAANILNGNLAETNMSTSRFKGIEEVQLEKGTVLDIKYNDLLRDGVDGPLKVKMALTKGNNDRKVDLGGTDPNSSSTTNLTDGDKTWVKSGTETENNVTYDVYSINGDINNSVWIQTGILVI